MTTDPRHAEVAIIGAGPAGMAAAIRLVEAGIRPVVFDMNPLPGGQIYRQLSEPQIDIRIMGKDYRRGKRLLHEFLDSGVDYRPNSRVWWAARESTGVSLGVLQQGSNQRWHAERLILASGAMERGLPFPGWQLPGVMNAGAAQILLKQGGLVPDVPPVLAGSGPLLYLLAWQYIRAGLSPQLVLDVAPDNRYGEVLRQPLRAWQGREVLRKGAGMLAALKRAGVPVLRGVSALKAEGEESVERIGYRYRGKWQTRKAGLLLTHFGIVPEPQLARSLGIPHHWHESQQGFIPQRGPKLDAGAAMWIAGDGGGIGGALNAEREGQLAALSVIEKREIKTEIEIVKEREALLKARQRDLSVRPLLDSLFRIPHNWLVDQPKETIVCRCENVTRGELDLAIAQGGTGPNQLKAFTRCGMGPCQGRQCGESVNRLLAERLGHSPDVAGYYHIRPPIHSVTLGELATSQSINEP